MKKENELDCTFCDGVIMEKVLTEMNFFENTITIDNVNAYRCPRCGSECIMGEEHDKIGKKLNALRKVEKEHKIKEISATL